MNIPYNINIQDSRKIWPLHFSHLAKIANDSSSNSLPPFLIETFIPLLSAAPAPVLTSKLFSHLWFLPTLVHYSRHQKDFSKYRFNLVTTLLKPTMPSVSAWRSRAFMSWLQPILSPHPCHSPSMLQPPVSSTRCLTSTKTGDALASFCAFESLFPFPPFAANTILLTLLSPALG